MDLYSAQCSPETDLKIRFVTVLQVPPFPRPQAGQYLIAEIQRPAKNSVQHRQIKFIAHLIRRHITIARHSQTRVRQEFLWVSQKPFLLCQPVRQAKLRLNPA
ncbi:hypothetical protein [Paraburkholderia aspalathi]|uniref:hypothetical protein n=1 Tax=Paraburkholderia aspalathi TaxID=1324617 RepID=UPI00190DBDDA|nr:hypothetical protein [Paraburkholderia aspalathi]MBK3820909.1 hypothetical protein [Paraburkholderia aspalathi]MBK3832698.1 hypothetical protein [Paraburkholderia aspalathi]MBK3862466.1 hypothetical protein [Paraburkholderia aspalathi]